MRKSTGSTVASLLAEYKIVGKKKGGEGREERRRGERPLS